MRNYWYPLLFSRDLPKGQPVGITLLGDPIVLFRDGAGAASALQDRCPHRSVPLSLGRIQDGRLECKYHGWQFDHSGACVRIPSNAAFASIPKAACAAAYPCVEANGFVWVWPGDAGAADPSLIVRHPEIHDPRWSMGEGVRDFDMDHGLMVENLLDPSHLPFTHEGTLAKRSDAQPMGMEMIDNPRGLKAAVLRPEHPELPKQVFTFDAPCSVRLDITLRRPGWRIVQVHYCVPLARRKMRFFWRIAQSFLPRFPGLRWLIAKRSNQIIDQDVAMLLGQQRRLDQGARPWACPVKADALAARYRAWREENDGEGAWFSGYGADAGDPAPRTSSLASSVPEKSC